MGIKRKLYEMLIGHDLDQEYLDAARTRYEQVVHECGQGNFPPDEEIVKSHVSSPRTFPNIFKVKTRMMLTKAFILENIRGEVDELSFLDVGGSSGIFFNLLGVPKENGCTVNVLKHHVNAVINTGYRAALVDSEMLPFNDFSFDYCFSFQCLEHTIAPTIHLSEMRRVSRKGIFLTIPYRDKTIIVKKKDGGTAFDQHIFEFSPTDLEKIANHCGMTMKRRRIFHLESNALNPIKRLYRSKAGFGKPSVLSAYFEYDDPVYPTTLRPDNTYTPVAVRCQETKHHKNHAIKLKR